MSTTRSPQRRRHGRDIEARQFTFWLPVELVGELKARADSGAAMNYSEALERAILAWLKETEGKEGGHDLGLARAAD
jgi:hypothetical protein